MMGLAKRHGKTCKTRQTYVHVLVSTISEAEVLGFRQFQFLAYQLEEVDAVEMFLKTNKITDMRCGATISEWVVITVNKSFRNRTLSANNRVNTQH